jgi:sortase (surface protein transpeptidase)
MSRAGHRRSTGRPRWAITVALVLLGAALAAGCSPPGATAAEPPPPAGHPAPEPAVAGGATAARGFRSVRGYQPTAVPVRIAIPAIGVSSTLERLGRATDGTVQVPRRWEQVGWYAAGPLPGDPGSAVILGHVDSTRGPAVFYRLRELDAGDEVHITRADGSMVRFVVQRTALYDKRRFPTDEVYFPTLRPALRLVTCGGEFDTRVHHYRANVIVFVTLSP